MKADIDERLDRARELAAAGQPEAALDALRLAQTAVRGSDQVPEETRTALDRQIQAQILSTARAEERIVARRADAARLAADQQVAFGEVDVHLLAELVHAQVHRVEHGEREDRHGGRGGDVILEVDASSATLLDFHRRPVRRAGNGRQGEGSNRTGADGADLIIPVPNGTEVKTAAG